MILTLVQNVIQLVDLVWQCVLSAQSANILAARGATWRQAPSAHRQPIPTPPGPLDHWTQQLASHKPTPTPWGHCLHRPANNKNWQDSLAIQATAPSKTTYSTARQQI